MLPSLGPCLGLGGFLTRHHPRKLSEDAPLVPTGGVSFWPINRNAFPKEGTLPRLALAYSKALMAAKFIRTSTVLLDII